MTETYHVNTIPTAEVLDVPQAVALEIGNCYSLLLPSTCLTRVVSQDELGVNVERCLLSFVT